MSGRTLLQQAVPVTFGLVAAGWLTAIDEARQDLHRIRYTRLAVQFGGAAGTLASLGDAGPQVATLLGEELGLPVPPLPWHTNRQRDRRPRRGPDRHLRRTRQDCARRHPARPDRGRRAAGGQSVRAGAARPPCRTSRTRSPRSSSSAPPSRPPASSPPWPPPPNRNSSEPPAPGTPSGSPSPTSSPSPATPPPGPPSLLTDLSIDPSSMRANLEATHGLPLAEHLANLLTPALGRLAAHDLVARASARANRTTSASPTRS